jgi:hypothetical protein
MAASRYMTRLLGALPFWGTRRLDGSADQVHRHEADADAHHRNRGGYRRRAPGSGPYPNGVSTVWVGTAFWRAPLRPRSIGSVCPDRPHYANHPRPLGGAAGGARRDAGRCPRGGADAGPVERHGFRRLRRGGADDCGGRCGGRTGIFGERTDARIRHPAGDRVAAAASAGAGDRGGHRNYGCGDWRRICVRAGATATGRPVHVAPKASIDVKLELSRP